MKFIRDLPQRTNHLGVACMANENQLVIIIVIAVHLIVDFDHKRTGRIDRMQFEALRLIEDLGRHAVSREDHVRAGGHVLQVIDEESLRAWHIFVKTDAPDMDM